MIVTVARDEALRLRISSALRDTRWGANVAAVSSVGEAQELLDGSTVPRAIIVGPSIGLGGATDLVAAASALRRPPPVLLVGTATTELLRAAMRAGIRDVLPLDFSPGDLVRAMDEAGVGSDGPVPVPGCTIAVFSTKGGVGTSVVAANLAARLAGRTGVATTLVDLDLASADQAIMHAMSPRWTIQDLADGAIGTDVESLEQVLLPIPGSGARLLPGPIDPALAETITAGHVAGVVAAVRADAPIAVLDTSSSFDDRTLAALDAADRIIVVSSLDVAALRSLTVSLQTLRRLGVEDAKVLLVMNRADSKSGLLVSDVEHAVERTVAIGIPSTRAVPRSLNEGSPLAVSAPRSAVVSAIDELVELLLADAGQLGEAHEPERSGSIFSRGRRSSAAANRGVGEQLDPVRAVTPVAASGVADDDEVDVTSVGGDGNAPGVRGDVVPMRRASWERSTSTEQKVVRRRADVESVEDESASDGADARRPLLDAMPPPVVAEGDDTDERPHQRRRR